MSGILLKKSTEKKVKQSGDAPRIKSEQVPKGKINSEINIKNRERNNKVITIKRGREDVDIIMGNLC